MLDAIELAPGERDDVGGRPQLLELAGGPRAKHRWRAHQRLSGRQVGDDDFAGLGVEHLRVGAFDREAQLHLAGVGVERHALRQARRRPRQTKLQLPFASAAARQSGPMPARGP